MFFLPCLLVQKVNGLQRKQVALTFQLWPFSFSSVSDSKKLNAERVLKGHKVTLKMAGNQSSEDGNETSRIPDATGATAA